MKTGTGSFNGMSLLTAGTRKSSCTSTIEDTATGHFTQVVWVASRKLGLGVARGNGKVVVVANYDPPGNLRGVFEENVSRPRRRN